mmetsp:Transcript_25343/g.54386  ORF Transcript_25343/g.54386 Transcript_25343/m.54386 type:complete len:207 (+) Transcript_25343:181-801(+)
MVLSHLTFLTPTNPGTTARSGYPWDLGIASPFISYAIRTSPYGLSTFSIGIEAVMPSCDSNWTCLTPRRSASSGPRMPRWEARMSRSITPDQEALLMAPTSQLVPLVSSTPLRPLRRLPPHCMVATTVFFSNRVGDWRSARVRTFPRASCNFPPRHTSSPSCSGLEDASMAATGTGWWWRTYQMSFGVIQLSMRSEGGISALTGLE